MLELNCIIFTHSFSPVTPLVFFSRKDITQLFSLLPILDTAALHSAIPANSRESILHWILNMQQELNQKFGDLLPLALFPSHNFSSVELVSMPNKIGGIGITIWMEY